MNYKTINLEGCNLHLIKSKKFHTIDFRIFFTENASKELITYRNALVGILTYATKTYNTKEKLIKRCQDLYSLRPKASTGRNGNVLVTRFGISTISSKYVDESNILDNVLLLKEIILNPLVSNNKFTSKYFNTVKKELESETKTIDEEPRLYANIKLLNLLNDNGKLLSGYSDLDILNEMTEEKLYQSYLNLINNSRIDIFVAGNFNDNKMIKIITDNFNFKKRNIVLEDKVIKHKKAKNEICLKKEIKNYQQSKLSIGFKFYNLTEYENKYVSFIFNNVFGGGANSLLMRVVREEKSLCYYIGSYINRLDNIIIVNSGINKENYDEVLGYIKKTLKEMEKGVFPNKDLEIAKMEAVIELSNIIESNHSIIEYYYGREVFLSDELKTRIEILKNVSKEDIMSICKKIDLEAIFLLEGDL